jgi:hypothetical protein
MSSFNITGFTTVIQLLFFLLLQKEHSTYQACSKHSKSDSIKHSIYHINLPKHHPFEIFPLPLQSPFQQVISFISSFSYCEQNLKIKNVVPLIKYLLNHLMYPLFKPLPSLTLQSTWDLNVPCWPKRSKALLL